MRRREGWLLLAAFIVVTACLLAFCMGVLLAELL